jgi:hypothetical protein
MHDRSTIISGIIIIIICDRDFFSMRNPTKHCERCDRILYFLRLSSVNSCPKITHLFW